MRYDPILHTSNQTKKIKSDRVDDMDCFIPQTKHSRLSLHMHRSRAHTSDTKWHNFSKS